MAMLASAKLPGLMEEEKEAEKEVVSPGASSGALWCCFLLFFSYVFSDGVEV